VSRVSKENLLYLPGKLAFAVMAVIAVPVYTHLFSVEDLGRFDLALRFSQLVWTLCVLWLSNVILRFYPVFQLQGQGGAFLALIGWLRRAGFLVGLLICALAWRYGPQRLVGSYRSLIGLAALVFVGRASLEMGLVVLNAKRKPLAYSLASIVNAVAKLGLGVVIAVPLKMGVAGLLWAAALVPMAVYLVSTHSYFSPSKWRLTTDDRRILREALVYGLPVMLNLLLSFLLANSDRYLLKYLLGQGGDAQVGIYSIGYFLADQPIQIVYATLMLGAFPAAMHMYASSGARAAETLVSALVRVYLLLAVPACVLLGVLAKPICFSLAHGEARQSFLVVPWVAAAAGLLGLMEYYTIGLYIGRRTVLLLAASVGATIVNLVANYCLIPEYGYYACGVARVISNGTLLVLMALVSHRYLRWRLPWVSLFRIALAAGIAGVVAAVVKALLPYNISTLGLFGGAGGLAYGASLLALREVSRDEVSRFLRYLLAR